MRLKISSRGRRVDQPNDENISRKVPRKCQEDLLDDLCSLHHHSISGKGDCYESLGKNSSLILVILMSLLEISLQLLVSRQNFPSLHFHSQIGLLFKRCVLAISIGNEACGPHIATVVRCLRQLHAKECREGLQFYQRMEIAPLRKLSSQRSRVKTLIIRNSRNQRSTYLFEKIMRSFRMSFNTLPRRLRTDE
jgi:hypothetical protein